ncbi:unnamed protein product [Mytilus edulis]|uniref:Uncharacterized protein n=1 Tax=Mytilus edulis TaxID=6550 RepID=A0A8S3UIP6_MYTED|nr:unnamed protein product [Mytilus edulis]
MPAVIGILLDLSKSMKETVYEKLDTNDRSRSRSIFKVIDELLIKENVLPENKIFALGFGAQCGFHTIDIIGSIQKFYEKYANSFLTYSAKAEKLYVKLETAGAHSIRTLLPEETLEENIPFYLLSIILDALETDEKLSKKLVARLPDIFTATSVNGLVLRIVHYYLNSRRATLNL